MTEVFKKILAQNLKKKKELEEIERKSLNKIKEEYSDEMKLYFNEYHNRKESDERHNKIKKELIEKHETTSALRGSDLIENLMLQISQEIDDIYQNILKSIHDIEKSKAEKLVEIKSNEYVQKLNDRINENTFIDKNEILESNKFFSDEVLVSFKNEINKDFEESHLKLITANLDRSLSEILIDFERKTETSIKDSQILLIQIIDSYVNKIKPLLNESTSDENFQIKHQELKAESMNIFKDKNTLKDRNKFEELLNNLESKLEEEFKVLLEKVEQKKYDFYEKLSTEIVNDYRKTMIENIERSDLISNDELLKLHEKYTEEAFSVLNKSITGTSELEKSFKQKLETRINVVFQNFIEENVKKEQNSISYCQNLMSELKTTYLTNMNPFLDGMTNKEKLNHQHEQEKNKCVEEFKQNSLSNQLWFQNLVDKLTEIIDCEFKNVQKLFTKNRESYIKSIINLCTNHYKNKISNGKTSEDFIAEDSLKRKHESLIEETQKKFKETVINISADEEIYLKKLEENILKIFENFKADNTKKKELLINKIQLIIKELKNSYMSKTRLFMNEEEEEILIKEHEKNKSELIDQFDRLFHAIDPNFMINFKEELIGEIEKDFKDLKDLFKLTSENNRSRVNAALESAKKCYKNEMDKYLENNIYFTEAELENRHGISADLALKVLREKIDNISLKHEEKLKNSLKIIYDQYQKTNKLNDKNINAMGIDLGTTYSCAAIVIRGKVTFVPNGRGRTTTPSYVSFNDSGDVMVGDLAKDQAHQNPANTIFDVKRLIGRDFDDENVKNDMQLWPFRVVDEDKKPKIELRCSKRRRFHPEEISAIILKKLKDDTKAYLGYEIKNAIITVPAYFNDAQRQATKCAGAIAGLNVLKILNEPTAAAVAYTHQMKDDGKRNVLVYDLGGGTFDVAVVVLNEGVIDVKAVGGDSHLGGQDFDQRLVLLCMQEFKKQSKKKIDRDEKALLRLRRFCEKVKWDLSANSQATVSIDELIKGHDFCYNITRAKFEEINIDLFEKTMQHVTNVLKDAGLSASQIDDIVTVGGSSRVPKIQEMLSIYFGGKVLNKSINPDEAVAYGAAIQAAIMDGTALDEYSKEIQDVAPFSIGIRLKDGIYSVIIPKNSKLPNKKSKDYQTSEDNQTKVEITIFEGEDEIADRNRLLGRFMIEGIPKKLVGEEKIKVLMEIDDEGILHVTGRVESNSQSNTIKIKDHRNKISEGELRMLINKVRTLSSFLTDN
jgi:L1 cell adhesion molecule like protein